MSSDYEDIDGNGPSLNDLGSYTQFTYTKTLPNNPYKWRIPFDPDPAMFNNGLFSKTNDQKANYIYGEKELVYLDKIVTKTHVAFFDLEERKDAIGTDGQHGGPGAGRLKKIKSIRLYSRPEITVNGEIKDPLVIGSNVKPIKTAHFIYSYDLCGGAKLTNKVSGSISSNEINNNGGKLTLKKVYFTYRNSNMGKYTPYTFEYKGTYLKKEINGTYSELPLEYDNKGFDIWGNFKPNVSGSGNINTALSTAEFPFVEQDKFSADQYSAAWTLNTVNLPSGGKITIETESDDYQFVQERKAMQMFKVIGAGDDSSPSENNSLYSGNDHHKYIYVKLSDGILLDRNREQYDANTFKSDFLQENLDKYISFRFLMNMTDNASQYDYVNGYFQIQETNSTPINVVSNASIGTVVAIPLKFLKRDGGTNSGAQVNPITKTGWGFGRTYLNREVYSLGGSTTNTSFTSIVQDLVSSIAGVSEIIKGPNKALQDKGCARTFKPNKSWIRLENPNGKKLGGGLRVKSVKLSDQWDSMLSSSGGTNLESMNYGQEYSYEENGRSTGVATFEPNASSENPLIVPFFPKEGNYAEKIAAPRENNYVEEPFGENFFPSPKITYSKVSVKNSYPTYPSKTIKKHASGKVVTTFYTSKDFPTETNYTEVGFKNDLPPSGLLGALSQLVNIRIRSHLTMSQGYSIETNDMNGKTKMQEVFREGVDGEPISRVEYLYNVDENNKLDNSMPVINSKGELGKSLIGLDYDMINDFNESYSENTVAGFDGNLGSFLAAIFPVFVPTILPKISYHENQLRTAVTTKHIHKTGILVEKIATDLGSTVSTKNLAWDASSGQVLLTETVNEYDDHYYSFSYPAYWMYDGMGSASNNIGIEGYLNSMTPITPIGESPEATNNPYFKIKGVTGDISKYFHVGDEIYTKANVQGTGGIGLEELARSSSTNTVSGTKLWVVGFNTSKSGILLMDRFGNYFNKCADFFELDFKIVRSGYRNLQSASMASITSMINPLKDTDSDDVFDTFNFGAFNYDGSSINPRVVNASAVVYKDFWRPQSESNLPSYPGYNPSLPDTGSTRTTINAVKADGLPNYPMAVRVNPFVWNIKGDWRAEKSYAYLTGRNSGNGQINNPRNEGFYTKFNPFYKFDNVLNKWSIDNENWTFASSVTQFSPYGVEIENKDALDRFSSAQYGYKYSLPMAVASNSKYSNMGYDGFESDSPHFGFQLDAADISFNHSHTGKKSVKVNNGTFKKLDKNLSSISRVIERENDCPVTIPTNCECSLVYSTNSYNACLNANITMLDRSKTISISFNNPVVSWGAPIFISSDDDMNIQSITRTNANTIDVCLIYSTNLIDFNNQVIIPVTLSCNGVYKIFRILITKEDVDPIMGHIRLSAMCDN